MLSLYQLPDVAGTPQALTGTIIYYAISRISQQNPRLYRLSYGICTTRYLSLTMLVLSGKSAESENCRCDFR
ncbi:MAG: hypothetical protein KME40_08640 [Komarekiella atlantica HA4396-MV6]|nr:hypothetical protein [Komarekiella atlantica HA4396-MV6]